MSEEKKTYYKIPGVSYKDFTGTMFKDLSKKYFMAYGLYKITEVINGDNYDIVKVRTLFGYEGYQKLNLFVFDELARRQVQTLTINQLAFCCGVVKKGFRSMIVYAFFPTYIPKTFDRKYTKRKLTDFAVAQPHATKDGEDFFELLKKEGFNK